MCNVHKNFDHTLTQFKVHMLKKGVLHWKDHAKHTLKIQPRSQVNTPDALTEHSKVTRSHLTFVVVLDQGGWQRLDRSAHSILDAIQRQRNLILATNL